MSESFNHRIIEPSQKKEAPARTSKEVRIIEASLHKEAFGNKNTEKMSEKEAIALSVRELSHVFIFSEKELTEIIDRESQ